MNHLSHLYSVILAGGTGERLWPLSRKHKPKQLLSLDDNTNKNLLDLTLERAHACMPKKNCWIITNARLAPLIQDRSDTFGNLIIEPYARNTGAAIIYSCLLLAQHDPNATVLFMPADHFIPPTDTNQFAQIIQNGMQCISDEKLMLFGITPTSPHTGYGYLEYNDHGTTPYHLKQFHEKPSLPRAQELLATHRVLWNSGMFGGKVQTFLSLAEQEAPEIFYAAQKVVMDKKSYEAIPAQSFDYAVMEKITAADIMPLPIQWYDVGSIEQFLQLKQCSSSVVTCDATNNLVDTQKLVALIGVDDLCIVETEDVLLIVKRNAQDQIRTVVHQLAAQKKESYL